MLIGEGLRECARVCGAFSTSCGSARERAVHDGSDAAFEAVWERQARGGPDERILSVDGGDDMFHF